MKLLFISLIIFSHSLFSQEINPVQKIRIKEERDFPKKMDLFYQKHCSQEVENNILITNAEKYFCEQNYHNNHLEGIVRSYCRAALEEVTSLKQKGFDTSSTQFLQDQCNALADLEVRTISDNQLFQLFSMTMNTCKTLAGDYQNKVDILNEAQQSVSKCFNTPTEEAE